MQDYPRFQKELRRHVYRYRDSNKLFVFSVFQNIEYLKEVSLKTFHQLLYSLKEFFLDTGEILFRKNDAFQSLVIVKTGELDVVLCVDGIDIII